MCASCSANGTERQCPSCRSLNPIGFPYDANAEVGTLWAHTAQSFEREALMCILGAVIYFAFLFGGGVVQNILNNIISSILGLEVDPSNPLGSLGNLRNLGVGTLLGHLVNFGVNTTVNGIALVGLARMLMDVLIGKQADLARMFSQLHLLPQYLAMQVVLFFGIAIPTIVYFSVVAAMALRMIGLDLSQLLDFRGEQLLNPALFALLFGSSVLFTLVMIVLLPVSMFCTPELIVGQCGPLEALKRSWDLGEGQRLRVFGYSLIAFFLLLAGVIACCVGLIVAFPAAYMLILSLFLALRRSSSLPVAIH